MPRRDVDLQPTQQDPTSDPSESAEPGLPVPLVLSSDADNVLEVHEPAEDRTWFSVDAYGLVSTSAGADIAQDAFPSDNHALKVSTSDGDDSESEYDVLQVRNADGAKLRVTMAGLVFLPSLPTSDPGAAGQLWNDSGALKVSAGS